MALLVFTTLFVVARTLLFSLRQRAVEPAEGVSIEVQTVAEHLAAAVRCRTVPLDDKGTPDPEAFAQLHRMVAETYPLVHSKLKREVINGFSLLYIWQGSRPELEPVMLMAHQDVVSADPSDWTHPPFEGVITNGFIWGRGTLDIKNQLVGIMEAAEALLHQGYRPERTTATPVVQSGLVHAHRLPATVCACCQHRAVPPPTGHVRIILNALDELPAQSAVGTSDWFAVPMSGTSSIRTLDYGGCAAAPKS